jgi:hypothetical protein
MLKVKLSMRQPRTSFLKPRTSILHLHISFLKPAPSSGTSLGEKLNALYHLFLDRKEKALHQELNFSAFHFKAGVKSREIRRFCKVEVYLFFMKINGKSLTHR